VVSAHAQGVDCGREGRWSRWLDPYRLAVESCLQGNPAALHEVRKIARQAVAAGLRLPDLALLHHAALRTVVLHRPAGEIERAVAAAGALLAAALDPFEAAVRESEAAQASLRRQNELLEQRAGQAAHTLFDETGQLLAALHLSLDKLEPAHSLLFQIEEQLRGVAASLRPIMLDHLGLPAAIEHLAGQRPGLHITVESTPAQRLSPVLELALYRLVEEALEGAERQAAREVAIRLEHRADAIVCSVAHDGTPSFELSGLRERVRRLGGELTLAPARARHTEIRAVVPV
jgi:signal transduction histidine kinase